MPRARRLLTMKGVAVRVVAMRAGAKTLCTAYATTKVLTPAATAPAEEGEPSLGAAAEEGGSKTESEEGGSEAESEEGGSEAESEEGGSEAESEEEIFEKSMPSLSSRALMSIPLKRYKLIKYLNQILHYEVKKKREIVDTYHSMS